MCTGMWRGGGEADGLLTMIMITLMLMLMHTRHRCRPNLFEAFPPPEIPPHTEQEEKARIEDSFVHKIDMYVKGKNQNLACLLICIVNEVARPAI